MPMAVRWLCWALLLSATAFYVGREQPTLCDSIYYTLLRENYEKTVPASAFIRELFETARCDDVFDLSVLRRDYASKINRGDKARLQRILDFKTNETDEAVAAQAVLHYYDWHERRLLRAVSWTSWWRHKRPYHPL